MRYVAHGLRSSTLRCKTSVRDLSDKKRLLAVKQETQEEERFVRLTANERPFNGCIPHQRVSCEAHVVTKLRSRSFCSGTINFEGAGNQLS